MDSQWNGGINFPVGWICRGWVGVVLTTIDGREFFQFKFRAVTNRISVEMAMSKFGSIDCYVNFLSDAGGFLKNLY